MDFSNDKAIFLQIADRVFELVLLDKWPEKERIPSIRDLAISMEVNPNTVMRTYGYLQENEIIYNRRGIGYFVCEKAKERTQKIKRQEFISKDLPQFVSKMKLLGIQYDELQSLFEKLHQNGSSKTS